MPPPTKIQAIEPHNSGKGDITGQQVPTPCMGRAFEKVGITLQA